MTVEFLQTVFDEAVEAMKLMDETLGRAMAIQRRSAMRLEKSGEKGIPVTIAMLGFETPAQRTEREAG